MFAILCGCHVDILWGLACISHLCRSGCFVCINYYGRPPVVISHFGGTFKMPVLAWYALLHRKNMGLGGSALGVYFCQARVKLWADLTDLIILLRLWVPRPHVLTRHHSHCSGCTANIQKSKANSESSHTKYLHVFLDFTHTAGATISETYLDSFIVLQQKVTIKPASSDTKKNKA